MALCATDDVALCPNRNLQSRIRYFSLDNARVLQCSHDDITIHKIPTGAINRLNHVENNQKDSKGLTFGDNKNIIDHNIDVGVDHASEIIISSADTSDLEGLV